MIKLYPKTQIDMGFLLNLTESFILFSLIWTDPRSELGHQSNLNFIARVSMRAVTMSYAWTCKISNKKLMYATKKLMYATTFLNIRWQVINIINVLMWVEQVNQWIS